MKKEERDLNFKKLFRMYLKRWWVIVVTAFGCMLVMGAFIKIKTPQPYTQITKKIIISNADKPDTQGIYETQNIMQRSYYKSMLSSQKFMEELSQNLNFDIKAVELQEMISVEYDEETAVFTITISNNDKNIAVEVADKLVDVSRQYLENNMSVTDFYFFLLDSQETEVYSSTNVKKAAIIGGLVGIIGSVVVLFIVFITNKKINDEDDIEYYLDMGCLGRISYKKNETLRFIGSEILLKYKDKQVIALGGFNAQYSAIEEELSEELAKQGKHTLYIAKTATAIDGESEYALNKSDNKLFDVLEYNDSFNIEASMPELKKSYDMIIFDLTKEKKLDRKLRACACADAVFLMIAQGKECSDKLLSLKTKFEDCDVKFADTILVKVNRKNI